MFTGFANSLSTSLQTSIGDNLTALVAIVAAVAGLGWGLHLIQKFGIIKRA